VNAKTLRFLWFLRHNPSPTRLANDSTMSSMVSCFRGRHTSFLVCVAPDCGEPSVAFRSDRPCRAPNHSASPRADSAKHIGLDESALNRYPHEFSGGQRQRFLPDAFEGETGRKQETRIATPHHASPAALIIMRRSRKLSLGARRYTNGMPSIRIPELA